MMDWLVRHGATLLIFVGGGASAFAAFVAERRASGQRELRRKGLWPLAILVGAFLAGVGALWAGYGQDRLFDYLSGGDSYGFFMPAPITSKSIQFIFVERGDTPLYDVLVDATDVSKWRKLWLERGWPPQALDPKSGWKDATGSIKSDDIWELRQRTTTSLSIGNIGPGANRFAWEAPVPESDDQRYQFSIWARNGLVTEQLLMHRTSSGWTSAWRVERTLEQVRNGRQGTRKLDEYIMPDFPAKDIAWQ